jgi:hypothetical protein
MSARLRQAEGVLALRPKAVLRQVGQAVVNAQDVRTELASAPLGPPIVSVQLEIAGFFFQPVCVCWPRV